MRTYVTDLVLVNLALVFSIGLPDSFSYAEGIFQILLTRVLPISLAAALILYWRRIYRIHPRYIGFYDFLNISFVAILLVAVLSIVGSVLPDGDSTVNGAVTAVLFGFCSASLITITRIDQRLKRLRMVLTKRGPLPKRRGRALIVGAGDAGEMVFREISKMEAFDSAIVGFVDDNAEKLGMTIHGAPVLGKIEQIPEIAIKHHVDEILIAMPSASGFDMRRVVSACSGTTARIRTLPSFSVLVTGGTKLLPMMREIQVEDLLRRDIVQADMSAISRYIGGERVLITGGGGSIGSELARQVALVAPASLVLLGRGENSIFEIDQELRHRSLFTSTPAICDVRNRQCLEALFKSQYPSVVFHAAAHKHVPLMESNPIEAVRNNVFGTLNTIEAAIHQGAKRFILVSTDKAVNPSSVMGATKRVAEMIVKAKSALSETSFGIVRFGNVLGSRGSLLPTLETQIHRGGPITITHPEMTRFFMTIPEAAQLILKAGSICDHGEIFILDMGEPVKILDLARDMIRMHGLVPGQDIEILFTGIRPGEKIHEILHKDSEKVDRSVFDKVNILQNGHAVDWNWLSRELDALRRLCDAGDAEGTRQHLMELAWGKTQPLGATGMAVVDSPYSIDSNLAEPRHNA